MKNTKTQLDTLSTTDLKTVTGAGFGCDTAHGCGPSMGGVNFGSGGTSFNLGGGLTVGPNGIGYKWL